MSGGEGLKFAASTILILTKSSIYDEKNKTYTGVRMKAALYKSRHTVEKMQAETKLDYATGMDRYYGLIEFAKKFGLTEKCGNGQKFTVGEDPKQFFQSTIESEPQLYFTKEVLDAIEEKVKQTFPYGKSSPMSLLRDEFDENDATGFAIDTVTEEPTAAEATPELVVAPEPVLDAAEAVKASILKKKAAKKG
jgi:hypothetical protein